jgi:uncharacterized repeat protein (TIGR03803 family)
MAKRSVMALRRGPAMPSHLRHDAACAFGFTALAAILTPTAATATSFEVLHHFGGSDGAGPASRLVQDANHVLYGTTQHGGAHNAGAAFRLKPPAPAKTNWTESVLFSFDGSTSSGPNAVLMDKSGALIGTTELIVNSVPGTIFRLKRPSDNKTPWNYTLLHAFGSGADGRSPEGELLMDAKGDIFGVTFVGGEALHGTVYELKAPKHSKNPWTETILTDFAATSGGTGPMAGLVMDSGGALYGTTSLNGGNFGGTAFKLKPPSGSHKNWTQDKVIDFKSKTGITVNQLIIDDTGILYGTAQVGGSNFDGTIFTLGLPASGKTARTETVLHQFNFATGSQPLAGLVRDPDGALYGTTSGGGTKGCGTIFKLTPVVKSQATWSYSVLHNFICSDGSEPSAALILDGGTLFGTAESGGKNNKGTVFRLQL